MSIESYIRAAKDHNRRLRARQISTPDLREDIYDWAIKHNVGIDAIAELNGMLVNYGIKL